MIKTKLVKIKYHYDKILKEALNKSYFDYCAVKSFLDMRLREDKNAETYIFVK